MGLILYAGLLLAFGITNALRLDLVPTYQRFGAGGERMVFGVAFALSAGCWLVRAWAAAYVPPSVIWSRDARTDSLVVAGPFRYTRNPLYLGNMLLFTAIAVFGPPLALPVIWIASFAFVEALIRLEERELAARFGDAFARYCKRVPQLFPRLTPAPPDVPARPNPRAGLIGEAQAACYAVAMLVLTVFGPFAWRPAFAVAVLGILLQRFAIRLAD